MAGRSGTPLNVDRETDALITQGAHFLGVPLSNRGVHEALAQLDGSRHAEVTLLSGLSAEEIAALGGVTP